MNENEDSYDEDKSGSLKHRFSYLVHPGLDTDNLIALKEAVRNQKLERDENILKKTEFDTETEDESSSKKINREDSELSDLNDTISKTFQNKTEDESSTMEKEGNNNTSSDKI